ncbi:hypothetical protein RHMOL_Rhmol08G0230800 [Rhododendron molle]|uniref:Uncharacterized protein n=1 Tax=Rhododendron molle TaxID=49168 RepID=A0ACC0MT07_RHOML|nr:hypothetical protein RHMOL_Rhmol08G0230800 [Rhododendron molle]
MAEQPTEAGRRRSRGSVSSSRSEALKRLKSGGGYQVKMEDPIYDTVADDEYEALVSKRREEFRGFIVDDDGLGYGDEGQEEDWTMAGVPLSDESEGEIERPNNKKKKAAAEKKKDPSQPPKKSSALSTAAALMGKQRLSNMFTTSAFNKKSSSSSNSKDDKGNNLSCDSILDDIITEFAPDESDRERRRRGHLNLVSRLVRTTTTRSIKNENPTFDSVDRTVKREPARASLNESQEIGGAKESELIREAETGMDLDTKIGGDSGLQLVECSTRGMVDKESMVNGIEAKVELGVKEGGFILNATIKEEKNPALSATAGWQAVRNAGNGSIGLDGGEMNPALNSEEKPDFELDSDGSLPFYILDAHEEFYGANAGNVYLFGKVKAGSTYSSCCVIVKNMQRCVFAIPNGSLFQHDIIMKLEKDVEESLISSTCFRTKLQEMASGLKIEIAKQLLDRNVSSFSMAPVKRSYAFERPDIPIGENYVLKINYSFRDPPLPSDLKGELFSALLGTHNSALELFLVKRKIKGPSWLSISKFSNCPAQRVSWCKFEVVVDCPKDIQISSSSKNSAVIPPVVVTAINLKTIISEKQNVNEIVSASIICCHKAKVDTPTLASEWTRPGMLSHFSVVRKLDGGIFPMGFTKEINDRNSLSGPNVISIESRQACKVPSNMWSKIGRLKRSTMPKLTKGSTTFGSGASPGIMSCIAGRLLCDTFLSSRELLREVSYSLTHLAKTQLKKDRKEIAPHVIRLMFQCSESLMDLVGSCSFLLGNYDSRACFSLPTLNHKIECSETDAWLSVELMFHLSILPLTRQLTNISGNLWGKTLQGARAQRVEYLLLHAFHARKYIVPDKFSSFPKETKVMKRKVNDAENKEIDGLDVDNANFENDSTNSDHGKANKGPSYAGATEDMLLKNLVERRRLVKSWLKNASGLKVQQLDIQQQALKLTANSMYGCLGFSNSRFYAKPLAELITLQGREILQSTVDLVQNNLNLEVIYGDTDSIMIYTGLDDIGKAKVIAGKVIQEVNKKYRCLEIDLDGLYKRMLLLKKKKYAAVKVQSKDGTLHEDIERKGLDMVRRDWSLLSKKLGDFCLDQILSGGSCEDVVESIHKKLMEVQEEMRNGQVPLEEYVITKSLTKPPEAYPDAKNQPHVEVALRLKRNGHSTGCSAGDTVPYVICCEQGASSDTSTGIAQRARHPDELKRDNGKWMVDIAYYLSQQIHPVVSRLCASIQGTSPARLANCLGLDSSKFQSKSSDGVDNDASSLLLCGVNDDERYGGCEPLTLSCPSCSGTFECPTVLSSIRALISDKKTDSKAEESSQSFWHNLHCPKCPDEGDVGRISPALIANQVKRQTEGFISTYYKGLMTCDDETCKYTTRSLNLRVLGDSERGTVCPNYPRCNGHLIRKYTEADLYKQLTYFCYVLDTVRCIEKIEHGIRIPAEKELARIRPLVDLAASTAQRIRDRCAFGWVQLNDLIVTI